MSVVYSYSCAGNFMTMLPEQRNDITEVLVIVINAVYDERMHADVLKTTSTS